MLANEIKSRRGVGRLPRKIMTQSDRDKYGLGINCPGCRKVAELSLEESRQIRKHLRDCKVRRWARTAPEHDQHEMAVLAANLTYQIM